MPYSPAMNGIAERANRTLTETARGLLIEAGLPNYFWPDAVRHACVAKNTALTHGEQRSFMVVYVDDILIFSPSSDLVKELGPLGVGEILELHYVKTTAQPADMMTKRLVEQQHWKCCKLAGMALN
ncbi:hypothetical protein CLOM_g9474 [Closterium sp. NIES-68]|nr:hypothetical protein CLOM_g9474 [Closterium sp. NIES-68]